MVISYLKSLYYTKDIFKKNYMKLLFWLVVRGFSLCIVPMVFPLSIHYLFNAIQSESSKIILETCLCILVIVIPIYMISFFICYYSDSFVMKNVYEWQKKLIDEYKELDYCQLSEQYNSGKMAYYINSSAWGGVQAWIHIFRIVAPVISALVLSIYLAKSSYLLIILVLCCWISDLLLAKCKTKIVTQLSNKLQVNKAQQESTLNEVLSNMHLHLINDSYNLIIQNFYDARSMYWKIERKNVIVNVIFKSLNETFERVYYFIISSILFHINLNYGLSSGNIGSAYTNFEKMRDQLSSMKQQIVATAQKSVPIICQRDIYLKNTMPIKKSNDNWIYKDRIAVDHLKLIKNERIILNDLSFQIPLGAKVAIIGENGCGKSSLLRCLSGLELNYEGAIYYKDKTMNKDMYSKIAYVTADHKIFNHNTVIENIMLGLDESVSTSDVEFNDILAVEKQEIENVELLSGGEKQRVDILRQYYRDAELFLYDEPTASLDHDVALKVMFKILDNKKTVIYVTHDMEFAAKADYIIAMGEGKLMNYCTANEYFQE